MGLRNDREHSSSWPYDPEHPLTSRREEFLPPWRQDEFQFRHEADPQEIKEAPYRERRTELPSDLEVKKKILETMANDSFIDERKIEVKVYEGDVTLSGVVSSHWMKLQLEGWVEQIRGVKRVTNNITVNPMSESN